MIVEHEFVTTLDMHDALAAARAFLADGRFVVTPPAHPMVPEVPSCLDMQRGEAKAARAKSVSALPQRVVLEYDRGRVRVATMITANRTWGGSSSFSVSTAQESPKKMVLHQQLLVAIANGLEKVLGSGIPPEVARADWAIAEIASATAARRRRTRMAIVATIMTAVLVMLIGLIVYGVTQA